MLTEAMISPTGALVILTFQGLSVEQSGYTPFCTPFFTPFSDLTLKSESCGTPFLSNDNRVCTPFFTPFF